MSTTLSEPLPSTTALQNSLTARALIIGVLALAMTIPLALVANIVDERQDRYESVLFDIANLWGEAQSIVAPIIVVPFIESISVQEKLTKDDGRIQIIDKIITHQRHAHFLPNKLTLKAKLQDETRQRGIFKSLVYQADLELLAEFGQFDINALSDNIESVQWDKAWLAIGLTDTRAINDVSLFNWNDQSLALSPGTRLPLLPSGFHARLDLSDRSEADQLIMNMDIKGTGSLNFAPLGESSRVDIESGWPHPSFNGSAAPSTHNISAEGFQATWEIPHLARNYPQSWSSETENINLFEFIAGVSMFEPVSLYSQVIRAVKYGILFIGLTFLTLFIFELAIQQRLHVIQYALIGTSLSLFFLILLSLAEHIGFLWAYVSAASITILMIASYVWITLSSAKRALVILLVLTALYSVLFSLLRLEDYALLMGTALLVLVLSILMFVTRNIQRLN